MVGGLQALNGHEIYDGCGALGVKFSNYSEIYVHFNSNAGDDYTNPSLPTGKRKLDDRTIKDSHRLAGAG